MSDTCDHKPLSEIDQKERRNKMYSGVESIDCADCGTTFILRRNQYKGTILLVKEDIVAGGTEEAGVPMHKTCLELWKTERRNDD